MKLTDKGGKEMELTGNCMDETERTDQSEDETELTVKNEDEIDLRDKHMDEMQLTDKSLDRVDVSDKCVDEIQLTDKSVDEIIINESLNEMLDIGYKEEDRTMLQNHEDAPPSSNSSNSDAGETDFERHVFGSELQGLTSSDALYEYNSNEQVFFPVQARNLPHRGWRYGGSVSSTHGSSWTSNSTSNSWNRRRNYWRRNQFRRCSREALNAEGLWLAQFSPTLRSEEPLRPSVFCARLERELDVLNQLSRLPADLYEQLTNSSLLLDDLLNQPERSLLILRLPEDILQDILTRPFWLGTLFTCSQVILETLCSQIKIFRELLRNSR